MMIWYDRYNKSDNKLKVTKIYDSTLINIITKSMSLWQSPHNTSQSLQRTKSHQWHNNKHLKHSKQKFIAHDSQMTRLTLSDAKRVTTSMGIPPKARQWWWGAEGRSYPLAGWWVHNPMICSFLRMRSWIYSSKCSFECFILPSGGRQLTAD
jgi:hypothetical protein